MIIIKIGGGKEINIENVIKDLKNITEPFIIVHGANAFRDELAEKLNSPKKVITSASGYQSVFTDETAIDTMMMAYSGYKNKRIVEMCQQNGINAIGLTGLDGGLIKGKKNSGIRVKENGKLRIVRDQSGKPKEINSELLKLLLDNNYTPVITMPLMDETGSAINSENDDVVSLIKEKLNADKVIQLIEAKGLLANKDDPNSLIKSLSVEDLERFESTVEGRMKRKIYALRKLLLTGDAMVYISDGRIDNPIVEALNGRGTTIS